MKLKELQSILKAQEIDLLLLLHPDSNINYLTQTEASFSVLKVTKNHATILLSKLDNLVPGEDIQIKEYKKTYKDDIKEELKEIKKPKIAINKAKLTIKAFESLQKEFPTVIWADFSSELEKLRLTKTEAELKIMFKAASIADTALANFVKAYKKDSKKFQTELDVALCLEKEIRKQGAILSFPTIVATKPNSSIPHHVTSSDKLQAGLLLIDMGAKYQNYCSDMTRMFSVGKPTKNEQVDFDLLLKTQEACIKEVGAFVKSQKPLEKLDKFARNLLKEKKEFFIHSLGHGIGADIHEAPRIAKDCKQKTKKNMPFTIEPGVYFKGKWGIRVEDTVFWDGKNVQTLTKSPKELIILQ